MNPQVIHKKIVTDELCTLIRSFELKAFEFGSVVTTTSNFSGEEFTHLHRLNFIAEGNVIYNCCGKSVCIEANTLVYLPPHAILEIEENSDQVVIFFINFEIQNLMKQQEFAQFMEQIFPNHLVHDKDNRLRYFFNLLLEEGMREEAGYCMSMQGIFYNIFISMIRFSETSYLSNKETDMNSGSIFYFNQAIHYINQNISQNIKISDIADTIGISENYLYKIFLKYAKKSPQQLILYYRIQLAKNYLSNPELSIKTISSGLGFANTNYFSTVFKKMTGLSPSDYRNSSWNSDSKDK